MSFFLTNLITTSQKNARYNKKAPLINIHKKIFLIRSQEIGNQIPIMFTILTLWHCLKDYEILLSLFVQMEQTCLIIHSIAVVWCRPHSHQLSIKPINVTLLNQLMSSDYKIYPIKHVEMVNNSVSENPPCTSRISFPGFNIFRVRPHQVSHRAFMGDLLFSVDKSHLIDCGQIRRKTSMDTQYVAIDNRTQREVIKGFVEVFPAVRVSIFFINFVQKSVHHGNVSAFVISPEQVDSIRIFDFEAKKESDGFD